LKKKNIKIVPVPQRTKSVPKTQSILCPSTGQIRPIVIYISFIDQRSFTFPTNQYRTQFNNLNEYYQAVSYDSISINPIFDSWLFLDYTSNFLSQPSINQKLVREVFLAAQAISNLDSLSVFANFNNSEIDIDGNNIVDNVKIIIRGNFGGGTINNQSTSSVQRSFM